jgi:hypothetical protein
MTTIVTKRMSFRAPRLVRIALAVGLTLVGPEVMQAQATIRGRVVDSETGQPIIGATVTLRKQNNKTFTTDSSGRFEARDLPSGDIQLLIQMLGFLPGDYRVRVTDSGEFDKVFSLDFTGQKMAPIAIRARAEQVMTRYTDFEARRQRGMGAFLRWDQLTSEKFSSVGDALRTIKGVKIQCHIQENGECEARMTRSPQCKPVWVIDGMEAGSFNENTPIRDVYGIEVYRGAGEIPGEYSGSNAACGVIVIWTKSRPFRSSSP